MRKKGWFRSAVAESLVLFSAGILTCAVGQARVLDNFNDNTKTDWTDSNPGRPTIVLPGGEEKDGKFTFTLPAVGQSIFVNSTKTSETFELKEGRSVEFRVDLLSGFGGDSFAVLAWIPQATGADTLAGYGMAKSETDILVTKGINKYFHDENPAQAIKNSNVTLVLGLKVSGGNVLIHSQILDKDANNAVLFDKTYVDTPAADLLATGSDSPPAPFITTGNFVLYLYEDNGKSQEYYQVVLDNAEVFVTEETILDDFNDNTKTGWTDSNPGRPTVVLPGGSEQNQRFEFLLPAVGQSIFVDSTKTTREFDLAEGTYHEFRVDMVSGFGADSFGILAWIPNSTGGDTLAGYGIAKSETDVLITKGINKYFFNANPTPSIKNENVTLVLGLLVQNGNVTIHGQILDKDANNAVLFDKTFVDTPAADILADGEDNPSAPFVTTGKVVLYLYEDNGKTQDHYEVIFDNLIAVAPPAAANVAPIISDASPLNGSNFLPPSTKVSFKVSDDRDLADDKISITLNGTVYTKANGLVLSGSANARTATLGGLTNNVNYVGSLDVVDADGLAVSQSLSFDTFETSLFVIETEDYNFDSGSYFTNPVITPVGGGVSDNSYTDRAGVEGVDFHDTRTAPNGGDTEYRTADPVRMARTLDSRRTKYSSLGDVESGYIDYDVGDLAVDEWLNYTRDFKAGSYEIYLREAVVNFNQAESVLEQVTSDRTVPSQTTLGLGSFIGKLSGFSWRNVPLTDATGKKVVLRLSGVTTLRLRHVTADTDSATRYLNYLAFLPVADAGVQRATVSSTSPANGETVQTVSPQVTAEIRNRDTSVKVDTVKLAFNGQTVAAQVAATADGATLSYAIAPLPAPGATNTAKITFKDSADVEVSTEWSFVVSYMQLDAANRASGTGKDRGFTVRMVQAPEGSGLANDLQRAEDQLALSPSIPAPIIDTNTVEQVVNMAQDASGGGNFPNKYYVPGLDESSSATDDFSVEAQAYLDLAPGAYRFGVVTDDGYKISAGTSLSSQTPVLGYRNGTANETFDFVVPAAGLYPFRMIWYERSGNAYAEWFSVNLSSGEKTLINDPAASNAIKAYRTLQAPSLVVRSSASVTGPFVDDATAQIDTNAKRVTVPVNGPVRFYQLFGAGTLTIKTISVSGGNVVLTYE